MPETADSRHRRRGWVLPTLAVVGLVVVCWGLWAALSLWGAAASAQRGLDHMAALDSADLDSPSTLLESDDSAALVADLTAAEAEFADAAEKASGPAVAPWSVVPVVGTQIDSVRSLAESAGTMAGSAARTVEQLDELSEGEWTDPAARVAALRDVGALLEELQDEVDALELGPVAGLVMPLAEARDDFSAEVVALQDQLDRAVPAAAGLADFMEGPSQYLLLAANSAEMRSGSGMYLQAAPVQVVDGAFTFGEFEALDSMVLDTPGTTLDPDVAANWTWLSPDRDFRNVNLTARFDESARMASEMWAASGRAPVQGVMAMDAAALQAVLEVVGPVEVQDADGASITVTADNVQQLLLLQQYVELGEDRDVRRDLLSRVASAALEAVNTRDVSPVDLLDAIQGAADGRHMLLWSSDPAQQEAFDLLGASGTVGPSDLAVAVLNRGGDKLDQFLRVGVQVASAAGDAGAADVTMAVELTNTTPDGLPTYVVGPHPNSDQPARTYQGIVAVTVPAAATGLTSADPLVVLGRDGESQVIGIWVVVPPDGSATASLSFSLPEGATEVTVQPSARARPSEWNVNGDAVRDGRPHEVDLAPPG